MRVRACRYRCGRDCVWACSAAGREADSPLERARPLRAGGQSGGCPGLRVLDARAGASGKAVTLPSCRTGVPGAGQRLRVLWGADRAHASSGPRGQPHLVPVASASLCDLFRPFPGPEGGLHLASLAGGEAYTRWFRQVPADEDPEGSARGSTWRRIFQGVRCPHTSVPAGPPSRPLLRGGLGEVPVCLNQSCEASEGGGWLSQAPLRRA